MKTPADFLAAEAVAAAAYRAGAKGSTATLLVKRVGLEPIEYALAAVLTGDEATDRRCLQALANSTLEVIKTPELAR